MLRVARVCTDDILNQIVPYCAQRWYESARGAEIAGRDPRSGVRSYSHLRRAVSTAIRSCKTDDRIWRIKYRNLDNTRIGAKRTRCRNSVVTQCVNSCLLPCGIEHVIVHSGSAPQSIGVLNNAHEIERSACGA